jgi:hypothetical protein
VKNERRLIANRWKGFSLALLLVSFVLVASMARGGNSATTASAQPGKSIDRFLASLMVSVTLELNGLRQ